VTIPAQHPARIPDLDRAEDGSDPVRRIILDRSERVAIRADPTTRRKRANKADADTLTRAPSARTIARLLTTNRDNLTKSETVTIAAIETGVLLLIAARDIITDFHVMVRRKMESQLMPWIDRARDSLIAAFGNGVVKDIKAVRAAIASPWSTGQTEGQITKLKLVKRQMYGRGKLNLLQARLIGAT